MRYAPRMPLYEYRCRNCSHEFEQIVKIGETPPCPQCGAADPERLLSLSVRVSTDKTRKRALADGRRRGRAVRLEKEAAQREYERNYIKEHS